MKRQCLTSLVTAAAVIAALTVPGSAAAYAAPGWITAQLTTGSLGNSQVQVSGDRVVWRGFDGMHNQIFTYKVGVDTSPVRLTSDANEHESPQVSGDRVVWQAFDGAHEQVFTRKVGVDPSAIQLTTHPQNSFEPHVSGDRVVWEGSDGAHYQIYTTRVGTDASPTQVTSNAAEHYFPLVSGDRTVWYEYDGSHFRLFTRKIGVDTVSQPLAFDPYGLDRFQASCALSGDRVAWTSSDKTHMQLFTKNVGVDVSASQITTDASDHYDPAVSGNRVVWTASDMWGRQQVFTKDIGAGTSPVQLTSAPAQTNPQVSDGRAVWLQNTIPSQIFTMKIGSGAPPVQLTTGTLGHQPPRVSGNRVVWTGYDKAGSQVFAAKPIVGAISIARSPNKSAVVVKRTKGVARYSLSATLRDADMWLLGGARVYLQTSGNGRTRWKSTYTLATNASGHVSKRFAWRRRSTLYFRWYAPARTGYKEVYSAVLRVRVR